jgi:protein PET100
MASRVLQQAHRSARASPPRLPPVLATHRMGGPNLEVFKVLILVEYMSSATAYTAQFGMYIMFPIGWMWYFGTNLDTRFSVPDFWPSPETTHKIPFEREELKEMSERLKSERLERRRRRLEQARVEMRGEGHEDAPILDERVEQTEQARQVAGSHGTFGRGSIERWARGNW